MKEKFCALYGMIFYGASLVLISCILSITPGLFTHTFTMDTRVVVIIMVLLVSWIGMGTVFFSYGMKSIRVKKLAKIICSASLVIVYIIFLIYVLFYKQHTIYMEIKWIPFSEMFPAVCTIIGGEQPVDGWLYFIYNTALFMPLGGILYWYCTKLRIFKTYIFTIICIQLASTIIQYSLKINSFRTDDLILTLFGSLIVYICCNKLDDYLRSVERRTESCTNGKLKWYVLCSLTTRLERSDS